MSNEENERTEEATPRRKQKERDKGNIAKSQDFTSSLMLICGVGLLYTIGPSLLEKIRNLLVTTLKNLHPKTISDNDFISIMGPFFQAYCEITIFFFALLAICAIVILRMQTGALFAKEALKPNMKKLNPSSAFKNLIEKLNLFKPRQMVEFIKSIIKTILVAVVGFNVIVAHKNELFGLIGADTSTGFTIIGSVMFDLLIKICLLLLVIGILDKKFQDWQYAKSIKMTKQEVKDEFKNIEGDPKIKGKIRSFQMKIMQQKMMSNVKEADVVVVNPTHYAVALKYDKSKAPAPYVVAKGVDFVAFKIREIAKNNGIPIIENKPLARSLYNLVEINSIIPEELYVAVAEILQYVYAQKNK